ncbi:MAG: hypothetical protein JWM41_1673 [Gemmatimonadetes bacterium]|nr:hypothetical protein [Gemmatimonadota bacterium]
MTQSSFEAVARRLALALPESRAVEGEASLELSTPGTQPARLISATVIEGAELRARAVTGVPEIGFAAFLDGTQKSRVARYLRGGIPVVHGTVGAVIRERRDKRMFTWSHAVEHRLYASRPSISETTWQRLAGVDLPLSDTSESDATGGMGGTEHPLALRETAVHRVQQDRENAEQALARDWLARDGRALLIDGGISSSDGVARASAVVGVIKSHRTLYASGDALATILALEVAERSSVFLVTSPKRTSVASWYLRIRDQRGREPMWGLVRVEVAAPQGADGDITQRADEVSRWILAEATPVSLPDGRWDKMVYGVRDCEEFLRAVM